MILFRLLRCTFSILLLFSVSTFALLQSSKRSILVAENCSKLIKPTTELPVTGQLGSYTIQQCVDRTADVKRALEILWTMLIPAIEEARYGNQNPAYDAFFKNGTGEAVRTILTNIREGTPKRTLISGANRQTPVFFCARSLNHIVMYGVDIFEQCEKGQRPPAMYAEGTNLIFLCPRHWEMPLDPTYVCPAVAYNLFYGDHLGLLNSMPLNLLHELVHFYVDSMSAAPGLEVLDWNRIVYKLSAADSAKNAYSYTYYVAGKSSFRMSSHISTASRRLFSTSTSETPARRMSLILFMDRC